MTDKQNVEPKAAGPLTVKMALQPGPVVRIIDDIEWSEAAGWAHDVGIELAANLLTCRHAAWWSLAEKPPAAARKALADLMGVEPESLVVASEPIRFGPSLSEVVGRERAAQMSELGFGVKQIAALTESEINDLTFRTGATAAEIGEWVKRAKG